MLYKKKNEKTLSKELFKNPTSEYRGTPFWAWNCELNKELLCRQIEYLKEMGFGGFHMHSRSGMATKYLSDEFMELVSACVEKAKEEDMLAYLYDEDRWPSGAAGGYVTEDIRFRSRFLLFTPCKKENVSGYEESYTNGKPALIASYDICLDENGFLKSYKKAETGDNIWYAYLVTAEPSGWYNNQTYVDTLNEDAMKKFIDVTYESYKKEIGKEFGKNVPSIFTDEPQYSQIVSLKFAHEKKDAHLPWTYGLEADFKEKHGFDITDFLPELFWEIGENEVSRARYLYYDYICERFASVFADQCGRWCSENGICLTGHFMSEPTLESQTMYAGEVMRGYRSFQIPGIDMLNNSVELSTIKQAQSAAHQYGREGIMSELYGVTNWDFDFRGHKFQGDWQAALGVTLRVPHLSWVSMKGSAKRDYPASISYQSPWYKKYKYIENHYARVNTALTRGKPVVDVAVIHPIESYWISNGPAEQTAGIKEELEENFQNVISWLLFGQIDFDFISESLLPSQYKAGGDTLSVGEMKYSAVVVPSLRTIRKTTLDILKAFAENGGKVIFMGEAPEYVDAVRSDEAKELCKKVKNIGMSRVQLLKALQEERRIDIICADGKRCDELIYSLREETDCEWLFIARGKAIDKDKYKFDDFDNTVIKVYGKYTPVLYDTLSGEIKEIPYEIKDGTTQINNKFYENDSLLIKLTPETKENKQIECKPDTEKNIIGKIEYFEEASYRRDEPNVYLLDMAKYSIDDSAECDTEEILRIDSAVREKLGFVTADGQDVQPWVIENEVPSHFVTLKFEIPSNADVKDVFLAYEEAEEIIFNEKKINILPCGYFVDEAIHKIKLGDIHKGINILNVKVPVTNRLSLENMFLLGEFNVSVRGMIKIIEEKTDEMAFSSITEQGLPFYGGNLVYETEIETPECDIEVEISRYKGALVGVKIDEGEEKNIVFSPYKAEFKNISAGSHKISFILYGNRYNTFAALHNCTKSGCWWGSPGMWYVKDKNWSYEYSTDSTGILKSPVIKMYEKN